MRKPWRSVSRLHRPIPNHAVETLLFHTPTFVILLCTLTATFLAGVRFYLEVMPGVATFLWPLFADSPVAIALAVMSVMTVAPHTNGRVSDIQNTTVTAYIHTFAFVWLVKYGLWAGIALNIRPVVYLANGFIGLFSYPMVIGSHLLFVGFAFVIVEYGRTTNGALLTALFLLLGNDVYDYVLGFHPPLEYEPGVVLPVVTVGLSFCVVGIASWQFDKLGRK